MRLSVSGSGGTGTVPPPFLGIVPCAVPERDRVDRDLRPGGVARGVERVAAAHRLAVREQDDRRRRGLAAGQRRLLGGLDGEGQRVARGGRARRLDLGERGRAPGRGRGSATAITRAVWLKAMAPTCTRLGTRSRKSFAAWRAASSRVGQHVGGGHGAGLVGDEHDARLVDRDGHRDLRPRQRDGEHDQRQQVGDQRDVAAPARPHRDHGRASAPGWRRRPGRRPTRRSRRQ